MNSKQYRFERRKRGSQKQVAALLGINRVTLSNRETGKAPITKEAALAMLSIKEDL